MTTIPNNDAVHAPDPPPGPKGPTKAAVDEAIQNIGTAQNRLVGALGEIDGPLGHYDLDEAQNWLREARLYVQEAERSIAYAREIRGHRAPAGGLAQGVADVRRPLPSPLRLEARSPSMRERFTEAALRSGATGREAVRRADYAGEALNWQPEARKGGDDAT
jgi:hypothetical protein